MTASLRILEGRAAFPAPGLVLVIALAIAGCDGDGRGGKGATPAAPESSGFIDVTARSGLRFAHENGASGEFFFIETNGSGLGFFDYDQDGDFDLYLVQGGALPGSQDPGPFTSRLWRNDSTASSPDAEGALHFIDVTDTAGCGANLYGTGCLLGDYDGDGWRDVFVYGFGPAVLFKNRGDGTFQDVTKQSGIVATRYAGAATWADFDRDGDLDLFVGNYVRWSFDLHVACRRPPAEKSYCHPDVFDPETNQLFENHGDGTFADVTARAGITRRDGKALGAIACDVDDDGDADLFVANDSTPNHLYRNESRPGELRFADASEAACVAYDRDGRTQGSMGVDFADVNGDLSPDLAVTNLQMEPNALYVNDGRGTFADESWERGVARPSLIDFGWGVRFFDFDDDADQDLLVVNGHLHGDVAQYDASQKYAQRPQLLLNDGKGRFALAGAEGGPLLEAEIVGRGLATADLDDDGDLDLAINTNDHEARLFERAGRVRAGNHWVGLELRGTGRNPDAIGAQVEVVAGGRTQRQEVRGGTSFASWVDLRLLFGLASAKQVELVRVRWPLGEREEFGPLPADRYHRIEKGSGRASR